MGAAARAGGLPVDSVGPLMDWALPDDPDRREELEALLEAGIGWRTPTLSSASDR